LRFVGFTDSMLDVPQVRFRSNRLAALRNAALDALGRRFDGLSWVQRIPPEPVFVRRNYPIWGMRLPGMGGRFEGVTGVPIMTPDGESV
jgi:hypothetical protein